MNTELTCACGTSVALNDLATEEMAVCPNCGAMLDMPEFSKEPGLECLDDAAVKREPAKPVGSQIFQTLGIAPGEQISVELPAYLINDNEDLLVYRLCISIEPKAADSPYIAEVMDAFIYTLADVLHGRFRLEIKPWNESISNAGVFRVLQAGLSNSGVFGIGRRYAVEIDGDLLSDEFPTSFIHLKKVGTTDAILLKATRMLANKASRAIIEHQIH